MLPTRRMKQVSLSRWLVRRDGVDFGPYSVEDLLAAIDRREVDLGTMVCNVAERVWEPAGSHQLFREHYAASEARWAAQEIQAGAARHERQLRRSGALKGGTRYLLVLGIVLAIGAGGYTVWRLAHARPTGILEAVAIARPLDLPAAPVRPARFRGPPVPPARAFPVLQEAPRRSSGFGSVAGVVEEGQAAAPVTRLDFDDSQGHEIPQAELDRIMAQARVGLEGCARDAASRSADFNGTRVTFVIRSRKLGSFTVGKEALTNRGFKACVKRKLGAISVSAFDGSERRVTIPLRVKR